MAPACPGCGHPAAALNPQSVSSPRQSTSHIQTIEQTSKKYKLGQLIGMGLIVGSVVACSSRQFHGGAWLLILGLVIYISSRMGAWWNNG